MEDSCANRSGLLAQNIGGFAAGPLFHLTQHERNALIQRKTVEGSVQ
jgi:hypothetical protein